MRFLHAYEYFKHVKISKYNLHFTVNNEKAWLTIVQTLSMAAVKVIILTCFTKYCNTIDDNQVRA